LTRCLHIVGHFAIGGAERVAAELLRTLDPEQFDVAAIALHGPVGSELEEMLAQAGIPVWYMGKDKGFDPSVLARVFRIIKRFRPQVMHTHTHALSYAFRMRCGEEYRRWYTPSTTSPRRRRIIGSGAWCAG
jgi:hypothetical protein